MLHTSLARILAPPTWPDGTLAHNAESAMPIFRSIASELDQKLCRKQTVVRELWNMEEMDVLALALQGKMSVKRFNLTCIQPDWVWDTTDSYRGSHTELVLRYACTQGHFYSARRRYCSKDTREIATGPEVAEEGRDGEEGMEEGILQGMENGDHDGEAATSYHAM
ncbi:unnamed protein product [Closterium sp. Naga37s-1]|nr:unnamed protein product [Closterium sp. Naga37s-1]